MEDCAKNIPENITVFSSRLFSKSPPVHGILLSVWDNIVGPRIQHFWQNEASIGEWTQDFLLHLATRTLNSSDEPKEKIDSKFLVLPEKKKEKSILMTSLAFSGRTKRDMLVYALSLIIPYSEMKWYLPLNDFAICRLESIIYRLRVLLDRDSMEKALVNISPHISSLLEVFASLKFCALPLQISVENTIFSSGQENQLDDAFIRKAITSHLQTFGYSVVIGNTTKDVNMMIDTLSLFLSSADRKCSRYVIEELPIYFEQGLCLQGLITTNPRTVLSDNMRLMLTNKYPVTLVDLITLQVKQTCAYHEHRYRRQDIFTQLLQCLWLNDEKELMVLPVSLFQPTEDQPSIIINFIKEVFQLNPEGGVRETFAQQFVHLLDRKALALIKYVESEINHAETHPRVKKIRQDLELLSEGEWQIVLARAEKMRQGFYCFLCGNPLQYSEHVRENLVTF